MRYEKNKIVYEAGDYITVIECSDDSYVGKVFIMKEENTRGYDVQHTKHPSSDTKGAYTFTKDIGDKIRLSSQEEINKVTEEEKIMVGENEVEFLGSYFPLDITRLRIGCVMVDKELFKKIEKKAGWL